MALVADPLGDFPMHDDWVYGLAVRSVVDDGFLRIPSFASANLAPQVYWGALFCLPFGFSFTALRVSTLVAGAIAIVGLDLLLRDAWRDRVLARVGAITLMVNPLFFALANTFMSDVPFLALFTWSLAGIARGLRTGRRGPLLLGLGIALLGVLLRQFAFALLLGFACAWIARRGIGLRAVVQALAPLVAGIGLHIGYGHWLVATGRKPFEHGIDTLAPPTVLGLVDVASRQSLNALVELGLFLLPFALFALRRDTWRTSSHRARVGTAIVSIVTGTVLVLSDWRMPLTGDVLNDFGIGPLMLRDTLLLGLNLPAVTRAGQMFWIAATGCGVVGAALLVLATIRGIERSRYGWQAPLSGDRAAAILFASTGASYFGLILLVASGHAMYDRYLLPLIVVVALIVPALRESDADLRAKMPRGAIAAIALFAILATAATHDQHAWQRARWSALRDLMEQGVDASRIDGGYEFNGWMRYDPAYEPHDWKSWWWVGDDEYLVASGWMDGYETIRRVDTHAWLPGRPTTVSVSRRLP